MNVYQIIFIAAISVYALLILISAALTGRFFKTLLISSLSGVAVFALVNIISAVTGVWLPVNPWSVGTSAVLGVPGVVTMLAAKLIFMV